jgi:hypothetical protein
MIEISVKLDRVLLDRLTDLHKKQIPFALARALTWTAQEAQKDIKDKLPSQFTLRNKFIQGGIQITPATKAGLVSEVGSITDFMGLQQEGGDKSPRVGKHLAIPVNVKGTAKGIIKKENRPRALLERGSYKSGRRKANRVFKIDENTPIKKRHGLSYGIYAAHTNQANRVKGRGITLLYALVRDAEVKPALEIDKTVEDTVSKRFPRLFSLSLDQAIASMR